MYEQDICRAQGSGWQGLTDSRKMDDQEGWGLGVEGSVMFSCHPASRASPRWMTDFGGSGSRLIGCIKNTMPKDNIEPRLMNDWDYRDFLSFAGYKIAFIRSVHLLLHFSWGILNRLFWGLSPCVFRKGKKRRDRLQRQKGWNRSTEIFVSWSSDRAP